MLDGKSCENINIFHWIGSSFSMEKKRERKFIQKKIVHQEMVQIHEILEHKAKKNV